MPTPNDPEPLETLLLVEDEPAIRDLMARRLERKGYRVLTAHNGQEALTVASAHDGRIDLLVTDVVMPHMDGFALEEQIVARFPSMKVLFMTGYADRVAAVRGGLKQVGRPYLLKPFVPDQLEQAIVEALRAPVREQGRTPDALGAGPVVEPHPDWRG